MQLFKFSFVLFFLLFYTYKNECLAQEHEQGQLLLQFEKNTNSKEKIRTFQKIFQTELESYSCISDVMNIYQVIYRNKEIFLDEQIRNWYTVSGVTTVQKNHLIESRETISDDPLISDQWHLKNDGSNGGTVDADIDATEAWDYTTGGVTANGDTIVVCIVETNGIEMTHPDLKNNHWKNYNEIPNDGIDNDGNGYIDDYLGWNIANDNDNIPLHFHGTRVAGMIGAQGNNGIGISGINWNVKMMAVVGNNRNESTIISAYTYPLKMRRLYNETNGQKGAFVVVTNSSWGVDGLFQSDSPLWCSMYDSLGSEGILNIGATTNLDRNVDVVGDLPSLCTSDYFIGVTASDKNDIRAATGYGKYSIDIAAPGKDLKSTTTIGAYANVGRGTSFATPLVAGAIALAYASPCSDFIDFVKKSPSKAALEMRYYLLSSVDKKANLTNEVTSGGRLNVKNIIENVINSCGFNELKEESLQNEIKIYPNPFNNDFTLKFPSQQKQTIELYDFTGKLVLVQNTDQFEVTVVTDKLENGMYVLKIHNEKQEVFTRKIAKL